MAQRLLKTSAVVSTRWLYLLLIPGAQCLSANYLVAAVTGAPDAWLVALVGGLVTLGSLAQLVWAFRRARPQSEDWRAVLDRHATARGVWRLPKRVWVPFAFSQLIPGVNTGVLALCTLYLADALDELRARGKAGPPAILCHSVLEP